MLADAAICADVLRVAVYRRIGCALGHQVDAPPQARTGGADAIDKGIGALEHFDSLQRIGGDDLAGQHTVQSIVRNVVAGQRQPTDDKHLRLVAKTKRFTHRWIVEQHITHAFGLLVLYQPGGVAGECEGHVHVVFVAQNPHLPAASNLATGKFLRGSAGAGL